MRTWAIPPDGGTTMADSSIMDTIIASQRAVGKTFQAPEPVCLLDIMGLIGSLIVSFRAAHREHHVARPGVAGRVAHAQHQRHMSPASAPRS